MLTQTGQGEGKRALHTYFLKAVSLSRTLSNLSPPDWSAIWPANGLLTKLSQPASYRPPPYLWVIICGFVNTYLLSWTPGMTWGQLHGTKNRHWATLILLYIIIIAYLVNIMLINWLRLVPYISCWQAKMHGCGRNNVCFDPSVELEVWSAFSPINSLDITKFEDSEIQSSAVFIIHNTERRGGGGQYMCSDVCCRHTWMVLGRVWYWSEHVLTTTLLHS